MNRIPYELLACLLAASGCVATTPAQAPTTTAPVATATPAPSAAPVSSAPPSSVTGVTSDPHSVILSVGAAKVSITAVTDHILRVHASPSGTFPKDFSWAVVPGANNPTGTLTVEDKGAFVLASTPEVKARIEKSPLRISFLDKNDQVISEDDPRHPMSFAGPELRVYKSMPEDEHYFGLGDKAGTLDRRDMAFTNWNTDAYGWQESTDPLYKTIPFFVGLRKGKAYGIFLDNTWRSSFDFGKGARDYISFGADGGELDYYFIHGPDPKSVVGRYGDLTGKPPLPPLWSLGFQQSRYSYYPDTRVRTIAKTFRDKKIPADVLYLDIDYQQNNRPFTVNRERFPAIEQMIKDLGKDGFKVIVITDPHLAKLPNADYKPYDEGLAGNYFVHNPDGTVFSGKVWPGASVFPDFTYAPARAWWGTLYREFVGMGIAGFWNDMNEPSVFETPTKTMPIQTVHRSDTGAPMSHGEAHNIYGLENSRATYEGLLKLQGNRRPFVLTRATYSGGQRYAASWTGDNTASWNHLRMSVATLLNLGLSGYALVGDDIGGFKGSPSPDMLTRWIELGVFNPIFRDHTNSGTLDQEPWVHGAVHEKIRKRYIETRYRLLPYIYTNLEETSRTGTPLMRPVWLEYPEAEEFYTNEGTFLFGRDLLVEPKLDETLDPMNLVLPAGTWFDYWTGEKLTGPSERKVKPALDQLPVFARAGAIIPQQPVVQSTSEVPKGPLELRVYPGPDCRGTLYMDDGSTFNYQKGESLRMGFTCQATADSVRVTMAAAEGSYVPWFTSVQITLYGFKAAPKHVTVGGHPLTAFRFDKASGSVTFTAPYVKAGQEVTVGN